jgi:hypothetical protein
MKIQILDYQLFKHRATTHRSSRQLTLNIKNYRIILARGSTLNLLSPRWRNHLKCFARMPNKKSLILSMSCQVGTLNDSHPSRQAASSPVTSAVASYRRIRMTCRTQLSTNKSDSQNTSFLNYRKNRFNRHRMNSEDFTWQTSY